MSDGAEKAVHGEKADHWKELKDTKLAHSILELVESMDRGIAENREAKEER